jgi:hypothetical protein
MRTYWSWPSKKCGVRRRHQSDNEKGCHTIGRALQADFHDFIVSDDESVLRGCEVARGISTGHDLKECWNVWRVICDVVEFPLSRTAV